MWLSFTDFMDFLFLLLGDIICSKTLQNTFYVIDTHMYIWTYLASKDIILHQRNFLALKWYVARLHKRIIRSTKSFVDLFSVLMSLISHVDYCYLHNIPNLCSWSIWINKCIGVSEKPFSIVTILLLYKQFKIMEQQSTQTLYILNTSIFPALMQGSQRSNVSSIDLSQIFINRLIPLKILRSMTEPLTTCKV